MKSMKQKPRIEGTLFHCLLRAQAVARFLERCRNVGRGLVRTGNSGQEHSMVQGTCRHLDPMASALAMGQWAKVGIIEDYVNVNQYYLTQRAEETPA